MFPGCSVVKNMPANSGDMGSTSDLGRSPGEGNENLLQHYCLDRGTSWAIVHEVAKSQT